MMTLRKNAMIILIGPSGVGKSSFLEKVLHDFPLCRDVITYTTRAIRTGESEGCPYHFVSRARFEELIQQNYFVEHAEVHGKIYGTPKNQIDDIWKQNQAVIMDIDVQGAKTLKAQYPSALTVFILPPNLDALRRRLIKREGKPPPDLDIRLRNAETEIAQASKFDHQIINDQFEEAYITLKKMIEEFLRSR